MKRKGIAALTAAVLLLSSHGSAYCDGGASYDDTVALIRTTMADNPSRERQETYGTIRFDRCRLDYAVSGTYPSGGLYRIRFEGLDFSRLDYRRSKAGHDYTSFITLNFDQPFRATIDFRELTVQTTVVNVSDDEKARILYQAFLHLGELCGAPKSPR